MSSSPEHQRDGVLRGADASAAASARLDVDLRRSRFVRSGHADPRLADPALDRAFEEVAAEVRQSARAAGYAAGWAQGVAAAVDQTRAEIARAAASREAADAQHRAHVARALRAITAAATALEQRAVVPADQLRESAIDAALGIAEAVLGRELAAADAPALEAVHRALDLAPRNRPVRLRLHPVDHAALAGLTDVALGREVTLVADPAVEPGGCVAECDAARVDAQLRTALGRVRAVLTA